jgi:hypothetical protein
MKKTTHNKVYSAYPAGYAPYTERKGQLTQLHDQGKQTTLFSLSELSNCVHN